MYGETSESLVVSCVEEIIGAFYRSSNLMMDGSIISICCPATMVIDSDLFQYIHYCHSNIGEKEKGLTLIVSNLSSFLL